MVVILVLYKAYGPKEPVRLAQASRVKAGHSIEP